jgi:hypothetical protein
VVLGNEAALVVVNDLESLHTEPKPVTATLPDGRLVKVDAAGAALRFMQRNGQWQPVSLHALRVRAVTLDNKTLLSDAVYNGPQN